MLYIQCQHLPAGLVGNEDLAGVMTATGVHNLGEFDPTVIHRVL